MMLGCLRSPWNRRKVRHAREEKEKERDARTSEMITDLQDRGDAAAKFLTPNERRDHWQEAIATMIQSGRIQ